MNFAVIENNTVVNVIVADSLAIAEEVTKSFCVEYTDANPAGIGWAYDGKKFIAPIIEGPIAPIIEESIAPVE
jgi:hypothetical protein